MISLLAHAERSLTGVHLLRCVRPRSKVVGRYGSPKNVKLITTTYYIIFIIFPEYVFSGRARASGRQPSAVQDFLPARFALRRWENVNSQRDDCRHRYDSLFSQTHTHLQLHIHLFSFFHLFPQEPNCAPACCRGCKDGREIASPSSRTHTPLPFRLPRLSFCHHHQARQANVPKWDGSHFLRRLVGEVSTIQQQRKRRN